MQFFDKLLTICFVCNVSYPYSPKYGTKNILFLNMLHMQMHQPV